MYTLCRSNVKACQVEERCADWTDAVYFDVGLCIWNEVRSWSLKGTPLHAISHDEG